LGRVFLLEIFLKMNFWIYFGKREGLMVKKGVEIILRKNKILLEDERGIFFQEIKIRK